MPTTQASPAVGATPATQARCDGGGRDFTPNAVSKRVRAKLMPLPSYQAYFRSAVKVKPFGRASATLTEIEYPLLVKRVFKPSPPRHRGAAKPPTATAADASRLCRPRRRRRPSGLRARYAGALRRGRRDFHTKRSLQEGKGKTDALTLLSQAYFQCCQGQALRARKRDLDRDRIPAFSKAGIQKPSPSPPPRLRR